MVSRAVALLLVALSACRAPNDVPADAHETPDASLDCSSGDPARGQPIADDRCAVCHANGFTGAPSFTWPGMYYPNLTPWALGDWTDQQIADAVRVGLHPSGGMLCSRMPRWSSLDDEEMCDVIAFLRQLEPLEPSGSGACIEE